MLYFSWELFCFMCLNVWSSCMYVHCVCVPGARGGQKRRQKPWNWMVVRHHVGVEPESSARTSVLKLKSLLSSPLVFEFCVVILSDVYLVMIIFHYVDCPFTWITTESFNFMSSHLSVVGLVPWAYSILCGKFLSIPISWNVPLLPTSLLRQGFSM